jgi:hypothetical protein
VEPFEGPDVFATPRSDESGYSHSPIEGDRGPIVDRESNKKDRRRKMPGVSKKMDHAVENGGADMAGDAPGVELDNGLTPALQAHIGRHVRAVFDEVAREPIPDHLLRLLKDLERSGDK